MEEREFEIGKMIGYISSMTRGFTNPKLVLIGGYALRRYVPFSRYSRECDFVLRKGLDRMRKLKPKDMTEEAFQREGFLRWTRIMEIGGKKIKAGIDFMENRVTGREGESLTIDKKFLDNSERFKLEIGNSHTVFVPEYRDLFLLKIISARSSDIRDIAAMIWKKGIPENIMDRAREVTSPELVKRNIEKIVIPVISDRLFIHSFRGTFVTEDFGETERLKVLKIIRSA